MTEREFLDQILDLASMLGYHAAHFRPAQTAKGWRTPVQGDLGKGWPDLVLVRERDQRLLFRELKADKGRLTDAQHEVHSALLAAGQDIAVWRPADFDAIVADLRGGI